MSAGRSPSFFTQTNTRRRAIVLPDRVSKTLPSQRGSSKRSLNGSVTVQPFSHSADPGKTKVRFTPQIIATDRLTHTSLALTLPLPPSINHQYATVRGRRVLSSTGRRYKAEIAKLLCSLVAPSPNRQEFLHALQAHFLKLTLHFYFPTLLRRDLDGGLKIAQDALCQALGINDNRILEVHLLKSADSSVPRMECTLSLIKSLPRKTRAKR